MYFAKTPKLIQALFSQYLWRIPSKEKVLYLTFDDGPIPEVTPWVLEQLAQYKAKATFFCVGDNVQKYPSVFQQLLANGHQVGNHTFHHLDGWKSENKIYFEDVDNCAKVINSEYFRPPYGHLKISQARFLSKQYRIVLWDILSGDFDIKMSKEKCLKNVVNNATSGSIIVFHDSLKAEEKLRFVLPKVLSHYSQQGFRFKAITI